MNRLFKAFYQHAFGQFQGDVVRIGPGLAENAFKLVDKILAMKLPWTDIDCKVFKCWIGIDFHPVLELFERTFEHKPADTEYLPGFFRHRDELFGGYQTLAFALPA